MISAITSYRQGCSLLLHIHIDNFKAYNDTYGFNERDKMLTLMADILKPSLLLPFFFIV